jgi:phage tail sheath protein FI
LIEVFKSSNLATPLESWLCSRKQGKKDGFGRNIYVVDVLESSNYIRARDNVAVLDNVYPKDQVTPLLLGGGNDGLAVTDSEMITAALTLANKDELLLTVLMDGGFATPAYQQALDGIASSRQDCVALLSVPYSAEASASYMTDIIDYRKTTLNLNSSYSALYTSHVKIYDRFNDRSLYVSPEGYAAAVISYSATNQEIWFPPAGYRRGIIQVLDVRRKFTRGEMDALYDSGINPIRFAPGKGIAVWGQKTLLSRPSSLDRLNVRLLLVVIEPAIAAALEDFLFEFNDEPTRSLATSIVDSYMVDIQARRGVQDFRVVCNSTNNTAVDIDNNRLNMDVFIKPNRSAEEINLRMVLTATSISFELAAQLI